MPRKTETLTQTINAIQDHYEEGDSAYAIDQCKIVTAEALITIAERLADIEKHLAAFTQNKPLTLEKAAKTKKES